VIFLPFSQILDQIKKSDSPLFEEMAKQPVSTSWLLKSFIFTKYIFCHLELGIRFRFLLYCTAYVRKVLDFLLKRVGFGIILESCVQ